MAAARAVSKHDNDGKRDAEGRFTPFVAGSDEDVRQNPLKTIGFDW